MSKFKGVLNQPLKRERYSLLTDPGESLGHKIISELAQKLEKLSALAAYYDIKEDLGRSELLILVLRLASDFVPGFMVEGSEKLSKIGAPQINDIYADVFLLLRVAALNLAGTKDTAACRFIAAEDDPKACAGPANKLSREAKGKTLQNRLIRARKTPFGLAVANMIKMKITSADEFELRRGITDARSFEALERLIQLIDPKGLQSEKAASGYNPEN